MGRGEGKGSAPVIFQQGDAAGRILGNSQVEVAVAVEVALATANDVLGSVSILENESTPVAIEADEPGVPLDWSKITPTPSTHRRPSRTASRTRGR